MDLDLSPMQQCRFQVITERDEEGAGNAPQEHQEEAATEGNSCP